MGKIADALERHNKEKVIPLDNLKEETSQATRGGGA